MRVLALDLATKTGWAADGPTVCPPRAGTFRVKGGGNELGLAGVSFSEWLCAAIALHKPDALVFEAPLMGGPGVVFNARTARLLIGLAFTTETIASSYGLRCLEEHVQSVRAHFVGQGRPKNPKQVVIERCKLLGWEVGDDNQADACALWAFAKAKIDRSFRLEAATPMFSRVGQGVG